MILAPPARCFETKSMLPTAFAGFSSVSTGRGCNFLVRGIVQLWTAIFAENTIPAFLTYVVDPPRGLDRASCEFVSTSDIT